MSSSMKGLISGIIVLAVLGGIFAFMKISEKADNAEESSSISDSLEETEKSLLYDESSQGVKSIKITNERDSFEVVRTAEATDDTEAKYAIKGYEDFEMNDNIISTLPNNISAVTATQTIEENPEDLEQYGLAKPVIDILVTFDDGTEKHLMVGNDTPSGDNTYFMIDGVDTVYTVSDTSVANFLKNRKYFFSRICLPAPEDQNNYPVVKSLLVERKDLDYNIKVEYDENSENEGSVNGTMSTHKLTEPVEAYLDVSKSTTYTHGLFGLTADSIHTVKPTEADLKATGLDNPQCTVTMVVEDGTEYKLLLGDSYEETSGLDMSTSTYYFGYFEGRDIIYSFTASAVPWATMKPTDITSLLVFTTNIYDIGELTVSAPDKETIDFKCEGEDSDTFKVTLGGKEYDTERFKSFYQYIIKTAGEEICTEQPTGEPIASIVLKRQDGKDGETVDFYNSADGNRSVIICHNGKPTFKCRADYVKVLLQNMDKVNTDEDFAMSW